VLYIAIIILIMYVMTILIARQVIITAEVEFTIGSYCKMQCLYFKFLTYILLKTCCTEYNVQYIYKIHCSLMIFWILNSDVRSETNNA
jgi:hypothetical protein